ncbi:MAG: thiamine phosphate synthase, partial [Myxococcales bacterium]
WGRELRSVAHASDSPLLVNRRIDVAQIVDADGVHLPDLGLPIAEIRTHWPTMEMLGVSRHDSVGLATAERDSATFAFLSPVFSVPGKGKPIGIHGLRTAIAAVGIPTYALGGIQPEDVKAILATGTAGIAVQRGIYAASDPKEALHRYIDALNL